MTYKEFNAWCNDRACDGCWGILTAITCAELIRHLNRLPFWKREKAWQEMREQVLDGIVNPINEKIREYKGVE